MPVATCETGLDAMFPETRHLLCASILMDFGGCFAYKTLCPTGQIKRGEQNDKEDLEEGEEDPTDQAVDQGGSPNPRLKLPF